VLAVVEVVLDVIGQVEAERIGNGRAGRAAFTES
jgi:hypothetical protein